MIHSYALEKKHLIQLIFFQFTPWTWKITILIEFRDDSILFVAFAGFFLFFSFLLFSLFSPSSSSRAASPSFSPSSHSHFFNYMCNRYFAFILAIWNFFLTEEKYLISLGEKYVEQSRSTVYSFKIGVEKERHSNWFCCIQHSTLKIFLW